jgi:hypothetical protein
MGWVVLAVALLAQGVGWWLNRTSDPEDSASTQRFVAILLSTFGIGLVLTGDVLYLAFVAEAVALFWGAARRKNRLLFGFGVAVQIVVLFLFLSRFVVYRLAELEAVTLGPDLAAIGAAVFIGARLVGAKGRGVFYTGAYLGLLSIVGWELHEQLALLHLVILLLAVLTQVLAARFKDPFWSSMGHLPMLISVAFFWNGLEGGRHLLGGDLASFVDLAVVGGAAFIGTLLGSGRVKTLYLFGAYVGLLLWIGRELYPFQQGQAWMSLAFGLQGAVALVVGFLTVRSALQKLGVATLLLVVGKVLLVDMAAVEPIWRVLLLFVFGGLFLLLSRFVQGRKVRTEEDEIPHPTGTPG